jgi:hypothetical protein
MESPVIMGTRDMEQGEPFKIAKKKNDRKTDDRE